VLRLTAHICGADAALELVGMGYSMARLRVLHGPSDHGGWESDGEPKCRLRQNLAQGWGTAPPLTGSPLKCSAYLPCLGVLCHAGPFRVRATAAVSRASILVGCVTLSAQRSVCLLFSRLSSNSWGRSLDVPPSTLNDRL